VSIPRGVDPLKLAKMLWPDVYFYKQQRDIIQSVWEDDETVVPAGNMLGKDFVSGRIVVLFFLTRQPCRIITTSAKDDHLRVLWGEIGDAIRESAVPLLVKEGGPLTVTHREIRKEYQGTTCPVSYVRGMVANPETIASMQGHHVANRGDGVPRTLFISDESSSVPDDYFKMARTWANRMLIIGNPWPCANYFFRAVEGDPATNDPGGDLRRPKSKGYYRKIIKIRAEDSPNVRLGQAQKEAGVEPTGEIVVIGVKGYSEYAKNRLMWDKIQQVVSLDAEFYKGREVYLFPSELMLDSGRLALALPNQRRRRAKAMGVDSAEGGDATVWTIIDEKGVIFQLSKKTEDTFDIPGQTIALIRKHNLDADSVAFDRGGGGKQHADYLRRMGYDVRTIGFGESASDPNRDRKTSTIRAPVKDRINQLEAAYAYKNRRAEMYGMASELVQDGFAIPSELVELVRQLKVMPKQFDGEGRLYLPPKNKPAPTYSGVTISGLLGRSPDEADSFVLAVFAMEKKIRKVVIG